MYTCARMYTNMHMYLYATMYSCGYGSEAADLRRDRYRRGRGSP